MTENEISNEAESPTEQARHDTIEGPSMAPKLQIIRGDPPGKSHPLKFKTRVGRETDNDIVIIDPRISRYHFQITYEGGKWVLADLGSANGTEMNGMAISVPQPLTHGDQITVGETVLVFRDPAVERNQPFRGADTIHGHNAPTPGTQSDISNRRMAWITGGLILLLIIGVIGLLLWLNRDQAQNLGLNPPATETAGFTILRTTPKPEQGLDLKYDEDFSDSFGGWDDAFGKSYTKQYGNNRYHIEITTNNLVVWGLANRVAADFDVEVEATIENAGGGNTYGIIFRYVDHDNFYRFDLSDDGFFLLSKSDEGVWSTLVDWTSSNAINQTEGAINVLKVSAAGPDIAVSINGEELARIQDDTFTEGNFGFFASTFESPQMWVSFDNLKLWAPPSQEIALIPTATRIQAAPAVEAAATPTVAEAAVAQAETSPTETPTPDSMTGEVLTNTVALTGSGTLTNAVALTSSVALTGTELLTDSPEATPTTATPALPAFVSRSQPLGRGETALTGKLYFPVYDPNRRTYDIFRANPDGSERELVQIDASQVAINAAGTHIAFRSWKSDERGLYSRPIDASEKWRFVQFFEAGSPTFSEDDQFFIFHSRQGGSPASIYRTFGTEHEVLRRDGIPVQGQMIAIVPGGQIVYRGCTGNTCGLVIANQDGGNPQQLTTHADDTAPAVSPDGQTIAFTSNREGHWDVYTMDVAGQNVTRLTTERSNDGLPVWSPDGSQLAFATDRDGQWAIWEMQPNGDQKRQLFVLPGPIDGVIGIDPINSFGWLEEHIRWVK